MIGDSLAVTGKVAKMVRILDSSLHVAPISKRIDIIRKGASYINIYLYIKTLIYKDTDI